MHNDDTAIDAWLGDAADTLTDEQRDRFITIWDDTGTRYPEPEDQDLRNAALSAATQYLLGEATATDAGREIGRLNAALEDAKAAARAIALLAVEDGASEYQLHQDLGVTRRTLRLWIGKDS